MTPQGWLRVRRRADDRRLARQQARLEPHAPADRLRRRPPAGARGRVHPGAGAGGDRVRADARLRRTPASWDVGAERRGRRLHDGRERRDDRVPAVQRHPPRHRGQPRARPPHDGRGREALLRALLDGGARRSAHGRAGRGAPGAHEPLLAHVAGRRHLPRPPVALSPAALGARAQGPHVHAHRRARRGAHDVAAGDAGRRAQLGLPLLLDARRVVHAVGAARARPRLGGRRLHPVRRRHGAQRGRLAADHVRDQRPEGPARRRRSTTSAATRARARCGSATAPTTSARTTCTARCSTPSTCTPRSATTFPSACGRCSIDQVRVRREGVARARPGDLGGARRAAPLRLLEADVLGRDRPRRAPGGTARRRRAGRAAGRRSPTRSARTSSRAAWTSAACSASTTTPTRSTPRTCSSPLVRFLAARRRARARDRDRDPRRADRGRPGPALPHRGDRRRPARRGGHVPDLLLLAGLGAVGDRRAHARPSTCASACCPTRRRSGCTPRSSRRPAGATWATTRRRSRTWR